MRESIEQEQLSRPSCRQALNAVCHQRSSPLRNARCRRYAHTEHCYAYGCCVCSVCCSTLSSTQQATGPICAGRYALDRGRFGRSNASLRCPVTAAYPEIRQGGRRLACKRACVCVSARAAESDGNHPPPPPHPPSAYAYSRSSSLQIAHADDTPRVLSRHRAVGVQACACACVRAT